MIKRIIIFWKKRKIQQLNETLCVFKKEYAIYSKKEEVARRSAKEHNDLIELKKKMRDDLWLSCSMDYKLKEIAEYEECAERYHQENLKLEKQISDIEGQILKIEKQITSL